MTSPSGARHLHIFLTVPGKPIVKGGAPKVFTTKRPNVLSMSGRPVMETRTEGGIRPAAMMPRRPEGSWR
jgi:hypothetical protein